MLDRAAGHADRERQGDDDQNEPEAHHGMKHPQHPQQHDADRQQARSGRRGRGDAVGRCGDGLRGVNQCDGAAPNRLQRNGKEPEAECVGDELAARQRDPESGQQPDLHPTEGKQADKGGNPPAPEASRHRVYRNDAESLVMGGQQQMADDDRYSDHEKDNEVAEDHLAQQRRPVECEEGADAAEGKRRHHSDGKGKA